MPRNFTARKAVFRVSAMMVLLGLLGLNGCASGLSKLDRCRPPFPPQDVMKSSQYEEFLAKNKQALEACSSRQSCEDALFNLGFVYAYSQSPYHDASRALRYFGRLVKNYPQSPRASEAVAWMAFINRNLALERRQHALQTQLKEKTATIDKLHKQMQRSREIDVEIGRKERQLLH